MIQVGALWIITMTQKFNDRMILTLALSSHVGTLVS
jgi:hypothetical protein